MNVLLLGKIHPSGITLLRDSPGITVRDVDTADKGAIETAITDADAILIRTMELRADLIARARQLKVVSRYGVGVDNIDVDALTRRGIPVAIVGQENAVSVAEQTMYLILAAIKQGAAHDRATRAGRWQYRDSGRAAELAGKQLLVVGLGRIGYRVARLCEAFDMRISFFDPVENLPHASGTWKRFADLNRGLAEADVISIHTPLMQSTRALIDRAALALMKPNAILVSTSRGGVVDEHALAEALVSGKLAGAGLDVFEKEPVPADNPLLALESVVLSPHMAALSQESVERMSIRAARSCVEGLTGQLDPGLIFNHQDLLSHQHILPEEHY